MSNPHDLKFMQVRKSKLEAELESLNIDKTDLSVRINKVNQELTSLNQRIAAMDLTPGVTEHAMLRYIERVLGVDLKEVEDAILTESNLKLIEFSPNCKIKSHGIEFIVKSKKVISVVA
jgi:hypothetical protein